MTIERNRLLELAQADPKAAAELLKKLQAKTVVPHTGGQDEIMADTTRFQIVCCGRRYGKTLLAAKKALITARKTNRLVWWVAPTYKVVKRGYAEVLRQLPEDVLTHAPPQDSAFDAGRSVILRFKNGSRIEFYSAERPEGMLGAGVDFAILDEAAVMNNGKSVWEQIIRPTLMDREGKALLISTPRGRNWFYYLWLRGQKKEPGYMSWRFPTSANPYIPPHEIEEMRETQPLVVYQQEVLAEFVSSAGAVFRFNPEIITDRAKPSGPVVVGVDLAKSYDFTVLSAARMEDNMPCGYERFNQIAWTTQRNRIKGFVAKLLKNGATSVTLVIDSGGPGDPICDELEFEGYDVVPINFTKNKQPMVVQLSKDFEDGYVRLDKDEEISEYENYTYKITDAGRWTYSAPEGQHDDCVSAKMLSHWGIVQEGMPNAVAIAATEEEDRRTEEKRIPYQEEEESEDWAEYLSDEDYLEEQAVQIQEVELRPDSPVSIMGRAAAWAEREESWD